MKDIVLGVSRGVFIEDDKEKCKVSNCQYCGFSLENIYHVKVLGEKNTFCCDLCHYGENLDLISGIERGSIILLPEISQVELFGLIRMIWYIKTMPENDEHEDVVDSAKNLEILLMDRREFATSYYAQGVDNVDIVINFLYTLDDDRYDRRGDGLKYLRWLPTVETMESIGANLSDPYYKKFTPKNFKKLISQYAQKLNK
jgi:hypothetical protein